MGDCCADYEYQCSIQSKCKESGIGALIALRNQSTRQYACQTVNQYKTKMDRSNKGMLFSIQPLNMNMISYCMPGLQNVGAKELDLCEHDKSNIVTRTPVSVKNTIYRNIFCAFCNGYQYDNITIWQSFYVENGTAFNLFNLNDLKEMNNKFMLLTTVPSWVDKYDLIGCRKQIDRCPNNFNGTDLISQACHNYALPVVESSQEHMVYKNEHCALCHNVHSKSLHCFENSKTTPPKNHFITGTRIPFNFTKLLQIVTENTKEKKHLGVDQSCAPSGLCVDTTISAPTEDTLPKNVSNTLKIVVRLYFKKAGWDEGVANPDMILFSLIKDVLEERALPLGMSEQINTTFGNSYFLRVLNPMDTETCLTDVNKFVVCRSFVTDSDAVVSIHSLIADIEDILGNFKSLSGDLQSARVLIQNEPATSKTKCPQNKTIISYQTALMFHNITHNSSDVPFVYKTLMYQEQNNKTHTFMRNAWLASCESYLPNCTKIFVDKGYKTFPNGSILLIGKSQLLDIGEFEWWDSGILVCDGLAINTTIIPNITDSNITMPGSDFTLARSNITVSEATPIIVAHVNKWLLMLTICFTLIY